MPDMTAIVSDRPSHHDQQELVAAVSELRAVLELWVQRENDIPPPFAAGADPSTLRQLCAACGLSSFERAIVLMCAGMELDGEFGAVCARAQGSVDRRYPTFSLALAAFPQAHWSALTPAAPLRRWGLIKLALSPGATLLSTPLEISERVLHFLTGVQYLDERLSALFQVVPAGEIADSQRSIADELTAVFVHSKGRLPVIHLSGVDQSARRAIAAAACAALPLHLFALDADQVPASAGELETIVRLWERECALTGCGVYIEMDTLDRAEARIAAQVSRFAEAAPGVVILGSREASRPVGRAGVWLDIPRPSAAEQRCSWEHSLSQAIPERAWDGSLNRLISQFSLTDSAIDACVIQAQAASNTEAFEQRLWNAARAQARPRLDDLAHRVTPAAEWDDLVLPATVKEMMREIGTQVGHRFTVHETWGFGGRGNRGLGICALFAGPSGTGKTMAAEVLARELRLDLYRIDLATVVSKYIGETEKNLRRVFDAAEEGGAILFFDEADALFGKRSEVKDSHDRYANIEISYLLQRMESYRGLSILATNMRSAIDTAFLRRIRFVANFPHPDGALRAEIWRRVFPANTPTESLNFPKLARLNVAGGNIRNIALNAAFRAAEAGEPVRMAHILHSARAEYAKLDKPLTDAEIGDFQ
jgi:ATPase family associated with various cellular activities (AAA)